MYFSLSLSFFREKNIEQVVHHRFPLKWPIEGKLETLVRLTKKKTKILEIKAIVSIRRATEKKKYSKAIRFRSKA